MDFSPNFLNPGKNSKFARGQSAPSEGALLPARTCNNRHCKWKLNFFQLNSILILTEEILIRAAIIEKSSFYTYQASVETKFT